MAFKSPLPPRAGLGPARVRIEHDADVPTMLDYLVERFPNSGDFWRAEMAQGDVVDQHGRAVTVTDSYRPGRILYYYRTPEPEKPVPFDVKVLHRDERLVVVDKPHFLATIPRGQHITETVLVRLRRDLGIDQLTPAHRLDRMTAGVLVFVAEPQYRRHYQELFANRDILKTYEAIARYDSELSLPCIVRSRIVKESGIMVAQEVPGEPNSETRVELLDVHGDFARYKLTPHTGKTHQLRLHMSSLGVPILGDTYYPEYQPSRGDDDYDNPLRLLARRIEFDDPVSGQPRMFESQQSLAFPSA
ncbi:pseudouridine synthase [Hoyosella rhizosphaerae]|uniref:RNA pseudouridylate synthase n=1 Tax=Hoyosella rhizosphaerae TaxID=1755582 RepID=A0A916XF77_9ACTN|nr:pseudouridine synthase [Hoyosella rhizosphaerae]MBN4926018.1 pseudouridine synthase [Hoyosella rhizosphaerae]GGC66179.1 pseudouridylate synthase [Hoyosella rhizosphaerae]